MTELRDVARSVLARQLRNAAAAELARRGKPDIFKNRQKLVDEVVGVPRKSMPSDHMLVIWDIICGGGRGS